MLTFEIKWGEHVEKIDLFSNSQLQNPPMRTLRQYATSDLTSKFIVVIDGADLRVACQIANLPILGLKQTFIGDVARYIVVNWPAQPTD